MNKIPKNQIVESAKKAKEQNPDAKIIANLSIVMKIPVDKIEDFEQKLYSLMGASVVDAQFEVRIENESEAA